MRLSSLLLSLIVAAGAYAAEGVVVWNFAMRDGERNNITESLTRDFEEALVQRCAYDVLERRDRDRLQTVIRNEKALQDIGQISAHGTTELKGLGATRIAFGDVFDDVDSGEVIVTVTIQDFEGKKVLMESTTLRRGLLHDSASRRERVAVLARKLCGDPEEGHGDEVSGAGRSPKWNLYGDRPSFLRLGSAKADLGCAGCWSSHLDVQPGERVFIATHFENYGSAAARDVRLRLEVPDLPTDGQSIYGELTAGRGYPLQGAACLSMPNIPILLRLVNAEWYPFGSSRPIPLPYSQEKTAVTSPDGLDLGDVSTGIAFGSDVIAEFQAVGVTLLAVRDVDQLQARLLPPIQAAGGVFDLHEVATILSSLVKPPSGAYDSVEEQEPRGWVSHLDNLRRGETIVLCVFAYNPFPTTLQFARLRIDPGTATSPERHLRAFVDAYETQWEFAATPISFARGASKLVQKNVFLWPYGFCTTGTMSMKKLYKLQLLGDVFKGLLIDDMKPETTEILAIVFEVQ